MAKGAVMRKAPDAFRTISEAADLLETPAHVLRFWESKFPQVKPVKRAGGRRYYRRVDIDLLAGIKVLLHDQGMTIRGVQKLLTDKGPRHVAELSPIADGVFDGDVIDADVSDADVAVDPVDDLLVDVTAPDDHRALTLVAASVDVPDPPISDNLDDRSDNAFAHVGAVPVAVPVAAPKPPAPAPSAAVPIPAPQAARLAHMLRTRPPFVTNQRALSGVTSRLEGLIQRMTAQADRDRARR